MTGTPLVQVSPEAPPVVRVFANTLKLSLQQAGTSALDGLDTVFALKSCKDPQAVTIKIQDGKVSLKPGVSQSSDLVFVMDFDHPDQKPDIQGLWRHPLLTLKIGKLLNLPLPDWSDSGQRFWQLTHAEPDMPARLVVTCSDEGRSVTFGEGEPAVEIIGKAATLSGLLAGNNLLVQEVIAGKIRVRGTMRYVAGLSGAGQKLMLGELDD